MAYKIAVASSDGINVDLHFGAAAEFLIYSVNDQGAFELSEKRKIEEKPAGEAALPAGTSDSEAGHGCGPKACASGCGNGNGGGCGAGGPSAKVEQISDVRAVVAAKIGFNVTKALEKKAIANFDVECPVQEALEKITKYFYSVDNHIRFKK